jgi:hypothetical protein
MMLSVPQYLMPKGVERVRELQPACTRTPKKQEADPREMGDSGPQEVGSMDDLASIMSSTRNSDFPEVDRVLRRASSNLTPQAFRELTSGMHQFLTSAEGEIYSEDLYRILAQIDPRLTILHLLEHPDSGYLKRFRELLFRTRPQLVDRFFQAELELLAPMPTEHTRWPKKPRLYHFTDMRNLPTIRAHGLLSWHQLGIKGIAHFPASNKLSRDLDTAKELQDYVHLCLRPCHPMLSMAKHEGRVQSIVWFAVKLEALWEGNVLFSNKNAAAGDAIIDEAPITSFSSEDQQAEVLVKGSIPVKWLIRQ